MRARALLVALPVAAALYVGLRAARMSGGGDGAAIYYGSRCLLAGRNPYPADALMREWAQDRPASPAIPHSPFRFINPPSLAALMAPVAALPWPLALPALALYGYACVLICVPLLCSISQPPWPRPAKLLFASYVLLLPSVMRVMYYGQSTLIVCAAIAAGLYALRRGRPGWAGLWLGLSLAKFTLSLPYLAVLVWRRQWVAAGTAVGVFVALNAALALPVGLPSIIRGYRQAVAETTAPGAPNDPAGSEAFDNQASMVHAERLFYVLLGPSEAYQYAVGSPERAAPARASLVFTLSAALAMAYLLRPRRRAAAPFTHPLDTAVVALSALGLFYHRYYDLATLMFVGYALVDYHVRYPGRQPSTWRAAAALLLVLSFLTSGTGLSALIDRQLWECGLYPTTWYNPLLVTALLVLALWMHFQDGRIARSESSPADPAGRSAPPGPA